MKNSKDKRDDRDWVPVSDIDEELDLPVSQGHDEKQEEKKPIKVLDKNLGYK